MIYENIFFFINHPTISLRYILLYHIYNIGKYFNRTKNILIFSDCIVLKTSKEDMFCFLICVCDTQTTHVFYISISFFFFFRAIAWFFFFLISYQFQIFLQPEFRPDKFTHFASGQRRAKRLVQSILIPFQVH